MASVYRSETNFEFDVWVVDNNSEDRSVQMVKEKFPEAKIIASKENIGFSAGNNLALRESTAQYQLLLNPDTIINERCLQETVDFMDQHPDAGALGIKMLDGAGNFLPESKRGLPSPWVAFYKIFGLSKLFKKSRKFGKYHLSYLSKEEVHEVDVLAGAFMLMRKSALDKAGLLDEQFFMYGEDIDLSYRIQQAGFKNYYFPKQPIIHYKGESTKTGSLNYVKVFYQAMILFAKKHYSGSKAFWFILAIQFAIYLRASLAVLNRIFQKTALPLLDFILLFAGMFYLKNYWETNHRYVEGGSYPLEFMLYAVPAYILIWLFSIYFSGGYDKPVKLSSLFKGVIVGTVAIISVYGLLPEDWRFSRALIMLGAAWAGMVLPAYRIAFDRINSIKFRLAETERKRILLLACADRHKDCVQLLNSLRYSYDFLDARDCKAEDLDNAGIHALIHQVDANELLFDAHSLSYKQVIAVIESCNNLNLKVRIIPAGANFIIGSDSAKQAGDAILQENLLQRASRKRSKRILDLALSFLALLTALFHESPFRAIKNSISVIIAKATWVNTRTLNSGLKRRGILPVNYGKSDLSNSKTITSLEKDYLENYDVNKDWKIYLHHWRNH